MCEKESFLITGAGMIGTFLAKSLSEKYSNKVNIILIDVNPNSNYINSILKDKLKDIIIMKGSIIDEIFISELFHKFNIKNIIHTAAVISGQISDSMYIYNMLQTNIIGTEILLRHSVKKNIEKFIFLSSGAVYNFSKDTPSKEPDESFCSELRHQTIYGATKIFDENLGRFFKLEHGLNFLSLRLCAKIYGPSPIKDDEKKLAWQKIIDNAISNKTLDLTKEQINREAFMYVEDAILGITKALENDNLSYDTYNLSSSLYGMRDFIYILKNEIENLKVIGDTINNKGYKYGFNYERAKKDFNFEPVFNLQNGIKKYIEYKEKRHE